MNNLETKAIRLVNLTTLLEQRKNPNLKQVITSEIDNIYKQVESNSDHQELQMFEIALKKADTNLFFKQADNYSHYQDINKHLHKNASFLMYGTYDSLHDVISVQLFNGGSFKVVFREEPEHNFYTMYQTFNY